MSVRMALAKLSACAVGGAVIGGGAVHVAERPAARPAQPRMTKAQPHKMASSVQRVAHRRTTQTTTTCAPGTVTSVTYPAPAQNYAALPAYDPALSGYGAPVPAYGGSASGGFGGGFFGGFFGGGGGSGGVIVVNSTSGNTTSGNTTSGNTTSGNTTSGNTTSGNTTSGNTTSGNTTSGNTTSGNTTSGNTTSGNTTSGNTTSGNTTSGNTTSGNTTSGNPEPVPAPPMVILFGAAAGALVLRRRLARKAEAQA